VFSWRPKSAVGANGIRNQLANMKKNKYIKAKKVLKKPKDVRSQDGHSSYVSGMTANTGSSAISSKTVISQLQGELNEEKEARLKL
jgi:hypothetical protein